MPHSHDEIRLELPDTTVVPAKLFVRNETSGGNNTPEIIVTSKRAADGATHTEGGSSRSSEYPKRLSNHSLVLPPTTTIYAVL